MDANLFQYLTIQAGYTIPAMANLLNLTTQELENRLDHQSEFTLEEMQAWSSFIGCSNPGAVFFPIFGAAAT